MTRGQRVYRTTDGRHVVEGHPEAAFLAYTEGDELPDKVAAELAGKKPARKTTEKARTPEENK